jgi:RNA polymerase sigma-70 factor (ECF subfamily)
MDRNPPHRGDGLSAVSQQPEALIDGLFRRASGRLVARLARRIGSLDLAEDCVQQAMMQALRLWPMHGTPQQPEAWLATVARNAALDKLRGQAHGATAAHTLAHWQPAHADFGGDERFDEELQDDTLRLMFAACHPALTEAARVALTLKTVCGFSAAEIARAFLMQETAVAQQIVRAKTFIRERKIAFAIPDPPQMAERLESVLRALYLLFNEGYLASAGDQALRDDLADDAIRLATLIADHPRTGTPAAQALLALMLLHAARRPTRIDEAGELVSLEEQDRSRWDMALITKAYERIERAATGEALSVYHLEAGIAAAHATAKSVAETDWSYIADCYGQLVALASTPVLQLNHAIALGMATGPQAGLAALSQSDLAEALAGYAAYWAARAEFHRRLGDAAAARTNLDRAIELTPHLPSRRRLQRRRASFD